MNISNYTFGLRGHDIGDDFPSMCTNGVENHITSLQFAMAKTVKTIDFDAVGFDRAVADDIHRKLCECGFSVPVLGCYINPIDADEERLERSLRRFEAFIRYAKVFHAGVVGTETGVTVGPDDPVYWENYRLFIRNLARLVEVAESCEVNIGIEPVCTGTVCSPQIMRRVIDDIGSDRVKVILDLSNLLTAEMIPSQRKILDDSFELLGDRIWALHLKDFAVSDGKKRFAPPTKGLMDIPYLFEQMSFMERKPDVILDNLPLELYAQAVKDLAELI